MKKLLICIATLAFPLFGYSQYKTEIVTTPTSNVYVFLGSLAPSSGSNLQKLKVEILGGAWEAYSSGETTYYIANRDGLRINELVMGSSNASRYSLHAYTNVNGNTDFYLLTSSYTAIAVKSVILGDNAAQLQNNITFASLPGGLSEILPLNIAPVLITDHDGRVAMGTRSIDPSYQLSVNGKVRAKEIRVETGWADYVFDDNYRLPALPDVQHYIKRNHHLPGIPSAAEVKTNGVNVGEMNKLLLKKVEELTLYMIEQNKQLKLQQKQIKFLLQKSNSKTK